jgi:hypothetical protein
MATYTMAPALATSAYQQYEATPTIRRHIVSEADMNTKKGSTLVDGDVFQVINIEAGEIVTDVHMRIITASTTSPSVISIGDGDSTSGWIADASTAAAAGTLYTANGVLEFTQAGSGTYAVTRVHKRYAADDTIDVLIGGTGSSIPAAGDLVFEVIVSVIPAA